MSSKVVVLLVFLFLLVSSQEIAAVRELTEISTKEFAATTEDIGASSVKKDQYGNPLPQPYPTNPPYPCC